MHDKVVTDILQDQKAEVTKSTLKLSRHSIPPFSTSSCLLWDRVAQCCSSSRGFLYFNCESSSYRQTGVSDSGENNNLCGWISSTYSEILPHVYTAFASKVTPGTNLHSSHCQQIQCWDLNWCTDSFSQYFLILLLCQPKTNLLLLKKRYTLKQIHIHM